MNYWVIKRYKEDPIKIKPGTATKVAEAIQAGNEFIAIGSQMIASKSISAVEETTERIQEQQAAITDGTGGKPAPILDNEGNVITNWYKVNVGTAEWDKHYGNHPGYYKLVGADNTVWAGMRLAEETNRIRPSYVELCTPEEARMLDAKLR